MCIVFMVELTKKCQHAEIKQLKNAHNFSMVSDKVRFVNISPTITPLYLNTKKMFLFFIFQFNITPTIKSTVEIDV